MDKLAANNHFVVMKKEIKKAKSMVSGNLIRKIRELKESKQKVKDQNLEKKLDSKIENVLNQIKVLKSLDPYSVAKQATLKPDIKMWTKLIEDAKVTTEERLIARVIAKNNIQKQVNKFRQENQCDEWINEYIEYREKKKELLR